MKTYAVIRSEKQAAIDALMDSLGVFFAYSNKQLDESKTPLEAGDKYISFASGAYIPKSNFDKLESGFDTIDSATDAEIKALGLEEDEVLYELENHESFYTGSIDDAMRALGDKYSREFVKGVYFKNQANYEDQNWFN